MTKHVGEILLSIRAQILSTSSGTGARRFDEVVPNIDREVEETTWTNFIKRGRRVGRIVLVALHPCQKLFILLRGASFFGVLHESFRVQHTLPPGVESGNTLHINRLRNVNRNGTRVRITLPDPVLINLNDAIHAVRDPLISSLYHDQFGNNIPIEGGRLLGRIPILIALEIDVVSRLIGFSVQILNLLNLLLQFSWVQHNRLLLLSHLNAFLLRKIGET